MPSRKAPSRPPVGVRTSSMPAQEDLERAKKDALLQLKIGRSAHLYTVGISAALALDGVLLLLLFSHLPSLPGGASGISALGATFYLAIPLAAALAIAGIGLFLKWGEFQLWPWEPHFATTAGALAVDVLIAIVYALRVSGTGFIAHTPLYPWFLPLTLVGITLPLLGLVLTWNVGGRLQTAAGAAAVLPLAAAVLLYLHPPTAGSDSALVAVVLFLSAILYQTSGSLLHLISSGTEPHEQALISTGQSRIYKFADELRQKEAALRFRESAVVRREADAEAADAALARQEAHLAETRAQVDTIDRQTRARADDLAQRERSLAGRAAEVEGIARQLESRVKSVEQREQEGSRQLPQLVAREQRLVARDVEQTKRAVELAHKVEDLERRAAAVAESETRLEARRKELDGKTTEILRREGEVTAREATWKPKGAGPPSDLAAREVKLQQLKTILDGQNEVLGRKAKETDERAKAAEQLMQKATEQASSVAAREVAIAQQERDIVERLSAADERRAQYENLFKEYQEALRAMGRQQVDSAQKTSDIERSQSALSEREKLVDEREKRLRTARDELDRRERDVHEREAALIANEAEVSLRRQEMSQGDMPIAGLGAFAVGEEGGRRPPIRVVGATSRGARPSRPAESPAPETTGPTDLLAPPTGRHYDDRLTTGTTRLDDLLLGGLPPRAHVVLLGDAFVGKEVVLYAFIAEGLKRGEPAILVSAARSPAEVSQSLGVVLPQFLEYEQMGMVTWIDASGSSTAPSADRLVAKGSDDRAGILASLVQAAKTVEEKKGGPFRVGFLGLSAVLAHGDERAAFSFLQNVVGILKPREALAMYSLEAGALSEAQVESLLGRMDGAIVFRQDRDRTFLAVKGFGDVQTREWVECRATNRALVVGSFALERIR
jgi:KaiC/GvpD/RAD55 family RecA-like ATPase